MKKKQPIFTYVAVIHGQTVKVKRFAPAPRNPRLVSINKRYENRKKAS
jgi:hypothetical protein